MAEVIPAILAKTEEEFLEKIHRVDSFVERVHLDIADGIFVPNKTIDGYEEIDTLQTELKISVHLMTSKPENQITRWLETQAESFIFHIESTDQAQHVIDLIKEADREVGITLNPETPIQALEPYIDQIDFVHCMTVSPGFYGSPFKDEVIAKVAELHYFYPDKILSADGGINPEIAGKLIEAGASRLVVGSYIFGSDNISKAIQTLQNI